MSNIPETDNLKRVRVLEIVSFGPATELEDLSALYPCTIKKYDEAIDEHVAALSPDDFIVEEDVVIHSLLKSSIVPGVYTRNTVNEQPALEKAS